MEENYGVVRANGKRGYFNKFVLIAKIGQLYVDDRKMLKCLIKQLKIERKNLDNTCYPLSDSDKRDIAIALTELVDILYGFIRPAKLERYNLSIHALDNYITKLEMEINQNSVGSVAQKAIDAVKDTAKNLSEKIGKSVEEIKKTVQGISLK